MKAVALKSSSDSAPLKKQKVDAHFPAASSFHLDQVRGFDPLIQRKSNCACGGGCPSCEKDSDGLKVQTKLAVSSPGDEFEQEADAVADQVMRMPDPVLQRQCKSCPDASAPSPNDEEEPQIKRKANGEGGAGEVASDFTSSLGAGMPLDTASRSYFEPRFGHDFGNVRIHDGLQAATAAARVQARAFTLGRDVVFAAGEHDPGSEGGKLLLAHELTHVVQQSGRNEIRFGEHGLTSTSSVAGQQTARLGSILAPALQQRRGAGGVSATLQRVPATNLGGYPEAERRAIQQSTIPANMIDAAFLLTVFGTAAQNGGATTRNIFGGTTVFDPAIPNALHRGLESTGAHLVDSTNVLPLGTTQTLVLDLTPYQGPNAMFRFTHLNHTENRVTTAILLIENVGAAPAAIAATPVPSGSFAVRGQNFTAGSGWNDQQFGRLRALLAALPDVVLTEAAGTTFALRGQGTPEEAGHYDAEHDTIEMHLNAFPVSATTFGSADTGTRNITHEIGHLLDLRRLERAWRTFNTGGQTAAGQRTLLTERSLSGSRWTAPTAPGGNFQQVDVRRTATGNDFREAATRDGIRPGRTATDPLTGGPTSYSDTDWQELFAESFSLYVNDPRLFALIRPNLFAYFSRRFPLPAAPAAPPQPAQGANPVPPPAGGR